MYESFIDAYDRGIKYFSETNGNNWMQDLDSDICFKTFIKRPNLKILFLTGGSSSIEYGIKNTGSKSVSDITVELEITGGIVFTGKKYNESINIILKPKEVFNGIINPIFGFGFTKITLYIRSQQQDLSLRRDGFLFLFYVYIKPA